MTDAHLSILLPLGSLAMLIPANRQFDVLDAHSNAQGSTQTDQDRRWPEAQQIAMWKR